MVKAAVLHGANDLRMEERQPLPCGADEARVAIKATGLCGSDLHYFSHYRNGNIIVKAPLVLGHEAAGLVTEVGSNVKDLKKGDRVALEVGVCCGKCKLCKKGRYNLCSQMKFRSSAKSFPHEDGTLQEEVVQPAALLHKMSETVSYEEGALIEPLSVVLHGARRTQLQAGQSVLVLGCGAVGLLACAIAHVFGAAHVTAVDIDPLRCQIAEKEGFADKTVVLPRLPKPESPDEGLKNGEATAKDIISKCSPAPEGYDVVFECTGVESCIQLAIYAARAGGKVGLVGMGTPNVYLPLSAAALREVDIVGVFRYNNTYQDALDLFASGKLKSLSKVVTSKYSLANAKDAFDTLKRGRSEDGGLSVKVMIGDY